MVQIRNIQLGGIGALAALATAFAKDGAAIQAAGFFQGYTPIVWSVICQVGLGGIITALVVRYADNILKGFATSLSIIVSGECWPAGNQSQLGTCAHTVTLESNTCMCHPACVTHSVIWDCYRAEKASAYK